MHGVYREIVPPEKISFTWTWVDEQGDPGPETLVTVTLEEAGTDGAHTKLTLHHAVFESVTARDAHGVGWSESFDRLAVYRSEEHTSEPQSLMRISYAVFCLKQKKQTTHHQIILNYNT